MRNIQGVNVSDVAYSTLKNWIISGQLSPGDVIPERRLAEELEISRTPVKDAMNRLASEGLIKVYPNKHSEVAVFTEKEIVHIGEIRLMLDLYTARLAIYYGSMADFTRLKKLALKCVESVKLKNKLEWLEADANFHVAFIGCSKNRYLCDLQKELGARIQLIQSNKKSTEEERYKLSEYHLKIVDALMERDLAVADSLIIDHFYEFYELDKYYERDFFSLF